MADHHLTEHDMKKICPYCKTDVPKHAWDSYFHGAIHYKTTTCNCGKDLTIKVQFIGSGHDLWTGAPSWTTKSDKKNDKPLEAMVQVESNKAIMVFPNDVQKLNAPKEEKKA